MISLDPPRVALDDQELHKQTAATKQMQDLITHVGQWIKYRILTTRDRNNLIKQGYARDLVDNLVYITERCYSDENHHTYQDRLSTGFTSAAFDPSIYATENIETALRTTSGGRCAWCESLIEQNHAQIGHYRQPYGYHNNLVLERNGYFDLAYRMDNLIYTCKTCNENYKQAHFPTVGKHAPEISLGHEQTLLINPYLEDPRQYIRFNPLTGHAYPYDQVKQFFQDTQHLSETEIEHLLYSNPHQIPQATDPTANTDAPPQHNLNAQFSQWIESHLANGPLQTINKGQLTIGILGLNRPGLVRARISHLLHLRGLFLLQSNPEPEPNKEIDSATEAIKKIAQGHTAEQNNCPQYCSLSIDAINTWQVEAKKNKQDITPNWLSLYNKGLSTPANASYSFIPPIIVSSLVYLVLERELSLKNKRRIICLSADDLLYGGHLTSKCVFLPINWQTDFHNVIKVHANNQTWDSNFSELASTQPNALRSLFAHNEVWAEGDYKPLS